jgi:hypothetical protein
MARPQAAGDTTPPELFQAEIQELQMVIRHLRDENQRLEDRNRQLMNDVLNLGQQIQAMHQLQAESPTPPEAAPGTSTEEEVEEIILRPGEGTVLYVNPHWHYLIVDIGTEEGLKTGDYGTVLREGRRIGIIKVTDTKANQSIAELDLSSIEEQGVYPRSKDQVRF